MRDKWENDVFRGGRKGRNIKVCDGEVIGGGRGRGGGGEIEEVKNFRLTDEEVMEEV